MIQLVGRKGNGRLRSLEGTLHPDFLPLAEVLQRQIANTPGGAAACVYHRGECVVDLWGGARDAAGTPWDRATMSPSFSTSKGVASTLVHIMVDRGKLDYDERVTRFWPEFGQAGKEEITLRHVLAHQSGLYHIRQMIDHADRMLDWPYMIRAIERASPVHPPGERTGYHGLTYGFLVGEILQRVTGRSFSDLVRDELAVPLNLDGLYVGAPEHELHRAAELLYTGGRRLDGAVLRGTPDWLRRGVTGAAAWLASRGPVVRAPGFEVDVGSVLDALAPRGIASFDFGANETLQAAIPAANGLFTARSLARMYGVLAEGGEIDGVTLISPRTLARATEPQGQPPSRAVIPFDMRWRLGYHGVMTTRGVPRQAFGHFGFGGSGAFADPSRRLAVGLIVNSGLGTPFGDFRIARIASAAIASVDARRSDARSWHYFARGPLSFLTRPPSPGEAATS